MTKLPRENQYICEYGCHTTTVDVDVGVTPFMIQCRSRSTERRPIQAKFLDKDGFCIGTAQSRFYPKVARPDFVKGPEWEWYRPTAAELETKTRDEIEHCEKGGLLLRPRTDREPVYHDLEKEKSNGPNL